MVSGFFPRRISERCHPSVPTAACAWRREAELTGRMRFDRKVEGWILFGDRAYTRSMHNDRELLKWQKVHRNSGVDTTGDQMILELCPGCGCELPASDGDEDATGTV